IISVVLDKAHSITEWCDFCPEYRELGQLRHIIPNVPIVVTSTTLPQETLTSVKKLLHIHSDRLFTTYCSTDRPNISIGV
ncbi:hypothetical protein SERLA73DRAFT_44095, partial [Serpula lacrymans var. lacrymans S7.3]